MIRLHNTAILMHFFKAITYHPLKSQWRTDISLKYLMFHHINK